MRIELYINSEEYATGGAAKPYLRHYRGEVSNEYDDGMRGSSRFVELPEDIVKLRDMLESIAHQYEMDIQVYDRTRIRDTVRAFFRGVRKTPTVIIGKRRFGGDVTAEQIVQAITEQAI